MDDIIIYIPQVRELVCISAGDGSNLLPEDIEEGYVDYVYYSQHSIEFDFPEIDGGQVMLMEEITDLDKYIDDVMGMAYGNILEYQVL